MSDNNQGQAAPSQEAASQVADTAESQENQGQVEGSSQEASGDVQANAEATLSDPAASKKEKEVAKKMLKKLKYKYNGKEVEEDLPFEIPDDEASAEYMKKHLQMSKLASSKASETAQMQKDLANFFEQLKKNPRKVLQDPNINVDMKKMINEMIQEEIDNSSKSPELLAKEKLEQELKSLKEEREQEKEEQRQRELSHLQEIEYQRYDTLMTEALEKHPDLPKSNYVVKKMADYMIEGLKRGIDLTPEDIVPIVKQELQDDLREMFSKMPEDIVEGIVGKETVNKLRKKNLAKAKANPPASSAKSGIDVGITKKSEEKPAQKISMKDFFKSV